MTPLLSATLAYALGLLAGLRFDIPLLLLFTGAVVGIVVRGGGGAWLFVVPGVLIGGLRADAAARDCRSNIADGTRVVVLGAPLALSVDGTTTAFHVKSLRGPDGPLCAGTTVRVRATSLHLAALDSAALGHVPAVLLHGRWLAYPARSRWTRNPEHAGGVMIDAVITTSPTSHENATGVFPRFGARQQERLRLLLPERWPLAEALLLAQTRGMTTETRDRWVDAGLVHLLAISGMHVGLICGGVLLLGNAIGLPRRRSSRAALLVAGLYVLFLGAPSAALRSLLQAVLLLTAVELQRPADKFTSLSASAMFIIVLEPLALIAPGFQLSFAGILGLMLWRRPLLDAMPRRLPHLVRDGIASGIAASALTTPIAALHFGTASWIGIPGTPVAVPIMAVGLVLLLVALAVAAITGAVTGVHAWAADLTMWLLDRVAAACAWVPGGHGHVGAVTIFACLIAAGAAIMVRRSLRSEPRAPPSHAPDTSHAAFAGRGRRRVARTGIVVAAGIAVAAWSPRVIDRSGGRVQIHAIDVGQGDAVAIRTPNGRWLLVDSGPRTLTRDAGRDRVVPFLLRHGVRHIDALILTHPHADHIGGARAVMDVFPVGVVIDPGLAFEQGMFLDLLRDAIGSGQRWIAARDDVSFVIDGVEITILYPFRQLDVSGEPNDFSVVVRLRFGAFGALFMGDAPESVEEQVVARYRNGLEAELLKVGHHGSRTSTGAALLGAARPDVALVTVGRNNVYRHPAPEVIARLVARRVQVLRTDQHGDIAVSASRDGRFSAAARRR